MSTSPTTPAQTIERFSELLAVGDLDAIVELYEPDAVFVPQPGQTISGREGIREALKPFLALDARMTGAIERTLLAGDIAFVANRWALNGPEVELGGTSADVLRRRPDGSWGIVIDDPWGAGSP
jgi:uncharacterized protein (TIGR02246 family)